MIKNIFISILILCIIINNVNSATITSVTGVTYGGGGTVTITGTGFTTTGTPTVSIGGQQCSLPKCLVATSCTCTFGILLPNATAAYDVVVNNAGTTTGPLAFKYLAPVIKTDESQFDSDTLYISLNNPPSPITGYQVKLDDTIQEVTLSPIAGSAGYLILFKVPQKITGGLITCSLIDPFGFPHEPLSITLNPTVASISPSVFNLTPTTVTLTGTFFGETATVIVGNNEYPDLVVTSSQDDTNCSVTFTTRTVYEDNFNVKVKTLRGNEITSSVSFTYSPPIITTIIQTDDVIQITADNISTDQTQLNITMTIPNETSKQLTIESLENKIISTTIPHAIPEGSTQFNILGGGQTGSLSLLIKPILKTVTNAPYGGGNVTINGFFLNNVHVSIVNSDDSEDLIACEYNPNGESLVCPTPIATGTIKFRATNYKSFAIDPSIKEFADITSTVTTPEPTTEPPSSPTPTPSPTTPTPSTPTPTIPTETVEPSSSFKLIIPLSTIFILLISIILI